MKLLLFLLLIPVQLFSQETFWTYYNAWCMGTDAQWSLGSPQYISSKTVGNNLGNITHVMIFPYNDIDDSTAAPFLSITKEWADATGNTDDSLNFFWYGHGNPQSGYASWVTRGGVEALRDSLHAYGKKILLTLNFVTANGGANYVFTDSARTDTLTTAIHNFIDNHDFDGVELNCENSITFTDDELARFFRLLDQKMPDKLITAVCPVTNPGRYVESKDYLDYVLPMCYAYSLNWQTNCDPARNGPFLKAPLYHTNAPAGSNHQDITTWGPDLWVDAGFAKEKIVIMLSNEANLFEDDDQMFSCTAYPSTFKQYWGDTVAYYMKDHGGTEYWDSVDIGTYIAGTATDTVSSQGRTINEGQKFYIPVLSDRNIDSVVAWARAKGYSHFGLFDIATDARTPATVKMPRHAHLGSLLDVEEPTMLGIRKVFLHR